jgi:hypothetical protein
VSVASPLVTDVENEANTQSRKEGSNSKCRNGVFIVAQRPEANHQDKDPDS